MIIDCKKYAELILDKARGKGGHLAIIQVGEDQRSSVYVRGKVNDCKKADIVCDVFKLPETVASQQVETLIDQLNRNPSVTGIIIQLPLPAHLDESRLCSLVAPEKDVDGFNSASPFNPCTPEGIVFLLKRVVGSLDGVESTIVGRGVLVGAPLQKMLTDQNMTVTACHSHTKRLKEHTRRADVVVLATGQHIFDDCYFRSSSEYKYISGKEHFRPQVVIDAGITFDENGKICGDLITQQIDGADMIYTTVPGGVGLLTRAVLVAHVAGVKLL